MYVRVVSSQALPDKMDEVINFARDSAIPLIKEEHGFKSYTLLTDPNTNKVIALSFWESESDAKASEVGHAQQRLPMVGPLLSGTPVSEIYQVSVEG